MRKSGYLAIFTFLLFFVPNSFAENTSPELVVHLLDYLANDYKGAVQNGQVISPSEYQEQIEFANIVTKNSSRVPALSQNRQFMVDLKELTSLISTKGSPDVVASLARRLQSEAILLAKISVAPRNSPDLDLGEKLYQTNCITCHGATGFGDGPAGKNLDPEPANFHDAELTLNSSPYKFFNTIRLGVPGTGMAPYAHLTDQEVWALAFYLKSLPHSVTQNDEKPAEVTLEEAATLSDQQIIDKLGSETDKNALAVASLRRIGFLKGNDPFEKANSLILKTYAAAIAGDYELAKNLSLRAYLEGIEPLEPKMKANLPGFAEKIETHMSRLRSLIDNKSPNMEIKSQSDLILNLLADTKLKLSENKMSPGMAFGAAFSIFLREGFEAVLIIIILMSVLSAMGQREAMKWVHFGWIAAISLGIIIWFSSGILLSMSGLSREILEGAIALFAVIVLVYVGFWLHRHAEVKKWRAFLEEKLKHGLRRGNYLGLSIVAFLAVFREAIEVVLFLRAIWIDLDSHGQTIASLGILTSLMLLAVLSYFAFKESKKLPLKQLFQVCSWTMMILAIILAGKGIHSLQEAAFVPHTAIDINLRVDLFGIYPSLQTLVAQLILLTLFAYFFWRERSSIVKTGNK